MSRLRLLLPAAAVALVPVSDAFAGQAYTTRIEPRAFYGATVTLEEGVRVFRPLPVTRHVVINPGDKASVSINYNEERSYSYSSNHNYNHDYRYGRSDDFGYGNVYGYGGGIYGKPGGAMKDGRRSKGGGDTFPRKATSFGGAPVKR